MNDDDEPPKISAESLFERITFKSFQDLVLSWISVLLRNGASIAGIRLSSQVNCSLPGN